MDCVSEVPIKYSGGGGGLLSEMLLAFLCVHEELSSEEVVMCWQISACSHISALCVRVSEGES